ncbi:hypothetical protein EAI_17575 [Harpegnathos saltator]|uniref:Uncharacterized protein n=1 Tax=Harpegnathos saltator TaxID=610380 RepID=E2BA84_HARSA|nr:hypothetical protein EAI_17575 [Harpegnathos saltator]
MALISDAYFKHDLVMLSMDLSEREPAAEARARAGEREYDADRRGRGQSYRRYRSCPWASNKSAELVRRYGCGPTCDVIEFRAYVSRKPNLWLRYRVLNIFECSWLATETSHCGQGIGRKLVSESWYLARDCGYRLFRTDCASSFWYIINMKNRKINLITT